MPFLFALVLFLHPATPCPAVCPPSAGGPVVYQPPVSAPVVDPFRSPATPYGPGNRGLEYALTPGAPVGAVADGEVVFAGPVAGALHVTVLHADGIRTSYSFLDQVLVVQGQRVARGQPVGLSGVRLHLGARTGPRRYIDPAILWGPTHVFLVPLDGGPPGTGGVNFGTPESTELSGVVGPGSAEVTAAATGVLWAVTVAAG